MYYPQHLKISANHNILIRYIPIQTHLRSQINLIADVHRRSFHVPFLESSVIRQSSVVPPCGSFGAQLVNSKGSAVDAHSQFPSVNSSGRSKSYLKGPHDNWIPSSVLFLIVEHVNIDTTCTSWNLISDVFNSI
jgi:hypothetical protein